MIYIGEEYDDRGEVEEMRYSVIAKRGKYLTNEKLSLNLAAARFAPRVVVFAKSKGWEASYLLLYAEERGEEVSDLKQRNCIGPYRSIVLLE